MPRPLRSVPRGAEVAPDVGRRWKARSRISAPLIRGADIRNHAIPAGPTAALGRRERTRHSGKAGSSRKVTPVHHGERTGVASARRVVGLDALLSVAEQ